jgi:uncharacterized oxidoreductase
MAALHAYTLSLRYLLREHALQLVEIVPPRVRPEWLNSHEEERAIALDQFMAQTMKPFENGVVDIPRGRLDGAALGRHPG